MITIFTITVSDSTPPPPARDGIYKVLFSYLGDAVKLIIPSLVYEG
jgi:hypothetical protein